MKFGKIQIRESDIFGKMRFIKVKFQKYEISVECEFGNITIQENEIRSLEFSVQ